ncbi:MAG: ribonuclease H-like domain-containing protein [cyanobacterium endosymbiont of Rhopalodia musculus]|uniref:ribonuclease H-like domain-containing protein n=1 Tax=cyanobacterium endosymbiont of Epithemia clementina EcSB TaxID=3034674 RepID=UPI0024807EB0|nr:ribonuclease H-like domain-containing protein [cyanobacterium endosymbiont of Epithemia clementina EcSB]WGT66664.1 ribonuclease H-like domain-containing protein [cyanobacterium endosymbiont of Epithemia clementina EcSB]
MLTLTNFQVEDCDLSDDTLRRYLATPAIAVDTETMGLIPQRDRLCLIQLCDPNGFVTAIRIGLGQTEAPNLKQLMESKKVLKVFHYARFDVAQLLYNFKIQTQPIFCTKIASKLARTYTNSHGLKSLVQELEGIELNKSSQSSDWGNISNLSEAQLNYAANDVLYLLSIQQKLRTMLKREGRWKLAQNCFDCIPVFVDLDLEQYRDIFEH